MEHSHTDSSTSYCKLGAYSLGLEYGEDFDDDDNGDN